MRRRTAACLAVLALAAARPAAGPQSWRLEGARAFLDGEIEGLSLDSDGRLRLGVSPRPVFDPEAPNAWCVARDARGTVYVGTGNEGRVLRVDGTKGSVLFDAEQLEVHALAVGPDGRVYAGTSPDGAVYAIDASGKATRFFDPAETYIWALAFDRAGALCVATGGEGRVYRVAPDGKAEALLVSSEAHILSLRAGGDGRVYAGSAPEGIVYRIDGPGRAFVLLDSAFREIKALDLGPDGSLYAAAIDGRRAEPAPRPAAPAAAPPPAGTGNVVAEVTVSESYSIVPPAGGAPVPLGTGAADAAAAAPPKGALLRLRPTGEIDTLWSSTDDVPHSAVATGSGVLVGTGNKGKVYRVAEDGRWALVATLPAEQVTGLARTSADGVALVTSNPARLFTLDGTTAAEGTFLSKVKDAEAVSAWGRLAWEGAAPPGTEVRLQTRAGNTPTPDATWTEWSAPATRGAGEAIRSERARFLQLRVTLSGRAGASPTVEAVTAAYQQRNLPPAVKSVTVHPAGEAFQKPISVSGEPEILGLDTDPLSDRAAAQRPPAGSPAAITFSRKLYQHGLRTFSWQAEDPNDDALLFEVQYRAVGDERWRTLRADLVEPVFAWDTATVPNGRYILRVVASDSPGNPPALALTGSKDTASFEVDNAPPAIAASLDPRGRIQARVRDDASPVRKLELSVDGGRWEEVHPVDGIADSIEETYDIPVPAARATGPRIAVLRATDSLGNVATARVDVP
jgi:outer membrane protein assembly factor BamB